ncbi:BsaA family SipW-dependent biofilm matrix protein [Paraclostridium bifermentans]|uniref:BsaA family SipW-dependent biofilm matrix protein n=1 Tax=Paraclostridium bifermentans TaxID=1490 RepID=UPI001F1B5905|nr:BsaA family SipW-dependent biofilm matrix protein [Paraclostridium bifermentans]MCE9675704.1 BsaA family SipW-dependent biofilm matrix protein [Paraclostridium bifermentans]
MNKKKIQALAVSGVLTVGVIGGTLAWFTSQDQLTNVFNTGSNDDKESKTGIKIIEEFEKPENMLPGDEVNKDVQVSNTTTYDQFIRVKLTPKFVDTTKDRKEIKEVNGKKLDINKIELNFTKNLNETKASGTWVDGEDGYYYYMGKVATEKWTNTLLDSVTLAKNAGNEYRGLGFDIDIEADSIQASHDAYNDWVKSDELKNIFSKLQSQNAVNPTDPKEPNKNN